MSERSERIPPLGQKVGYKKARSLSGKEVIITLEILGDNNESRDVINPDYAKYRCTQARVLDIRTLHGTARKIASGDYKPDFLYKINEIVGIDLQTWNYDYRVVCGGGIHYFKTRDAAVWYNKRIINGEYKCFSDNGALVNHYFLHKGVIVGNQNVYDELELNTSRIQYTDKGVLVEETEYEKGYIKHLTSFISHAKYASFIEYYGDKHLTTIESNVNIYDTLLKCFLNGKLIYTTINIDGIEYNSKKINRRGKTCIQYTKNGKNIRRSTFLALRNNFLQNITTF